MCRGKHVFFLTLGTTIYLSIYLSASLNQVYFCIPVLLAWSSTVLVIIQFTIWWRSGSIGDSVTFLYKQLVQLFQFCIIKLSVRPTKTNCCHSHYICMLCCWVVLINMYSINIIYKYISKYLIKYRDISRPSVSFLK